MLRLLSRTAIENQIQNDQIPQAYSAPLFIEAELTHRCNLRCIHCYNSSGGGGVDLDDDSWIKLCNEASEFGLFYFTLSGGEPLLRRKLCFRIIDILNEHYVRLTIISNGWLLDDSVVERLKRCHWALVVISIDGSRASIHDHIRGVRGSWQRAVDAAKRVSAANLPLRIVHNIFPTNYQYIEEMIELAMAVGASSIQFGIPTLTGRAAINHSEITLEENTYAYLCDNIEAYASQLAHQIEVIAPQTNPRLYLDHASRCLNGTVLISANGDVKLDCIVPISFGNITRQSILDIWNTGADRGWQDPRVTKFVDSVRKPSDLIHAIKNTEIKSE